jgi:hypothetical protein
MCNSADCLRCRRVVWRLASGAHVRLPPGANSVTNALVDNNPLMIVYRKAASRSVAVSAPCPQSRRVRLSGCTRIAMPCLWWW